MRLLILTGFALAVLTADIEAQERLEALDAALVAYFQADSPAARAGLAAGVAAMPGITVDVVAQRLHQLPLWPAAPPGRTSFDMEGKPGERRAVWVRVPPDYDPAQAWPVMIALHGTHGRAEHMLDFAVSLLGRQADRMIVAAPQGQLGDWHHTEEAADVDQPIRVLRRLRRRYHVDSDRVFLAGYSLGAHRTCTTSAMFADQLAGALPLAGSAVGLPLRDKLWDRFLPNWRHLPVLLVWGEVDTKGPTGEEAPGGGIAGLNQRLARMAQARKLPLTAIELPGVGHRGVVPPADRLAELLGWQRQHYPRPVSHWFRFPNQGHAYWLKLIEFVGEPWTDQRIQVRIQPGQDADEALLLEMRRRLAKLEGTIDGQRITVRAKRAKVLEVLLHDELVDLDRPITIKLNGRMAFKGLVERRVETLLELAAEDWDLDRVFPARVRIAVGQRGWQE